MQTYLLLLQRRPQFRLLWLAELVSLLGDWFNTIASVMLVNRYAGSGLAVGGLFLARSLPPFLVGPLAGVVADRFDRKTVLIAADLLRALIVLGFLLIDRTDRIWLIYVLSIAQFVVSAFFEPARAAIVPQLVAEGELVSANTLSSVTWSAMLALGAAVGGATAAVLGAQTALVIDSLSFVASAVLIGRIVRWPRTRAMAIRATGWADFAAGLGYVRRNPEVGWVALVKGLGQVGSMDVMSAFYAKQVFPLGQDGAATLGLMLGFAGLGAILGPLVGNWFHDQSTRQLQRAITGGFVVMGIGWLVMGLAPSLPLALVGITLRAMGGSLNWTYSDVLLQMKVANQFLGRVFALNLAFFTLAMSVSVWANSLALDQAAMDPRQLAVALAAVSLAPLGLWAAAMWSRSGKSARATPPDAP